MFNFLTDNDAYENYFRALATQHKEIDGFLYGDEDVQLNATRAWKGIKLWLEEPNRARPVGPNTDNLLKDKRCSLWVGGSPPSSKYADVQAYYNKCEKIVEDIIARVLRDRQNQDLVSEITSYEYGMARYTLSTELVGCRWDFSYLDPTGYPYKEENWQ